MKIITLTTNQPIYINADKIVSFFRRTDDTITCVSIIGMSSDIYVSETPEEIVNLINNN